MISKYIHDILSCYSETYHSQTETELEVFFEFSVATNPVVAALGAANVFIYAVPYTLSKQHTEWNTWIGKSYSVKV